ncbi:TonB-dependent receptor [Paraflavitalea pollutisoli]|uniref:TonB-dependent receptor n=1 Tax=Paraflavitalea pollutisoli TaxID=3034143 RepID=UPI0023ED4708|nr:TonB-dependent receptor [Paraflavitalea sp. H1-2-19X]
MNRAQRILLCLTLLVSFSSFAQKGGLFGKVTTPDGLPLGQISITLVDTRIGTQTDENGVYAIRNLKAGTYTVQVSFTGSVRETKSVTVGESPVEMNFSITPETKQLEEVIVETGKIMNRAASTSNKLSLSNLETPQIVHSISSVVLRKQNAMTLEDAMKNAPGVTKLWDATSRPDGGSFFVSRGFQTSTKVRNGVANIVNTNVEMANLERIEVIKGPSATMFGSIISSYGGLINRVTKKPYFKEGGYADVSYGSYNFYRASADANFVLTKDKLAARINVAGQNQDSWQDAGFQRSYIIAPSILYKPNNKLSVNVDAEIVGSKGNGNGGNFLFVLTPSMVNGPLRQMLGQMLPPAQVDAIMSQAPQTFKQAFGTDRVDEFKTSYDRSFLNDDIYATTQSNAFFGEVNYKFSRHWNAQSVITYSNSHNSGYTSYQYLIPNYVGNFINSLQTGVPNFGTPGHDSLGRMVWNPVGSTKTFNFQQNFSSDYQWGKVRNRAVAGFDFAYYRSLVIYNRYYGSLYGVPYPDLFDIVDINGQSPKMNQFNKENVLNAFATRPGGTLPYDQESSVYSGYINNVTNITDYVIVSAGVRVDHFKNKIMDQGQTKWSPKVGLILMPLKEQLTVFANYQNSFTNKFGGDKNNKPFNPEEANQVEFGAKYNLFKNKLTGSVSYYNVKVKDVIRMDLSDPMFNIQDGEQHSKGIEAEIVANPYIGWTILFGYGYNDSKYVKADADVEGLRPVGTGPRNTANFWTNYTFTKNTLKGLGIGVSANYAGEANAVNQHPDGALILPAYSVIGAHVTYDTKRYRLGVKVNNITDKEYWMGWSNYIPQMRRQLIGTIAVKF